MPTVKHVEATIRKAEGFDVAFISTSTGRDIRGDMDLPTNYPSYGKRSSDTSTVADWKRTRFAPNFPGFAAVVLDSSGRPVHGSTLLSTVRATYG